MLMVPLVADGSWDVYSETFVWASANCLFLAIWAGVVLNEPWSLELPAIFQLDAPCSLYTRHDTMDFPQPGQSVLTAAIACNCCWWATPRVS